ncbi:hypothetical protein [Pseudomonas sp. RIT-PI-AD]|uniref:WD40 repeat domain-containing protein n=1 Tax=Pseudomonas sp. RIT-PI-AD TaxID=3035294 RepID=UPI0021DA8526|nr:hypothetical protein [Pseudomonas sp. RIT-PI-AD]
MRDPRRPLHRPLLALALLFLAGCRTEPPLPLDPPPLIDVGSDTWRLPPIALAFSKDARHFLAAGERQSVRLYDSQRHAVVNEFTSKNRLDRIYGAGFIEGDTYYIASEDRTPHGQVRLRIDSLSQAMPRIERHFNHQGDRPFVVNARYASYYNQWMDWHTEQWTTEVPTAHPGGAGSYRLTEAGNVLTTDPNRSRFLLHDPRNGRSTLWKSGLRMDDTALLQGGRQVVTVGAGGSCEAWSLPDHRSVGTCTGAWFASGYSLLAVAPHAPLFAVANGTRVRVYALSPWQLLLEQETASPVSAVALSDRGHLAVARGDGSVTLWNASARTLVGALTVLDGAGRPLSSIEHLAVSDHGQVLVSGWGNDQGELHVLETPEAVARREP